MTPASDKSFDAYVACTSSEFQHIGARINIFSFFRRRRKKRVVDDEKIVGIWSDFYPNRFEGKHIYCS